ncbi:MAG: YigZ family protein [Tenericutes bacterium]|nr:MAG: YigZ family protein [Mycoplasmatota bacterium]
MYTHIVKKSKFIAYSFSIKTPKEVKEKLEEIKNEHKDARHIVYAFLTSNTGGMSDDGEPSGTAGKPLMNLLNLKKKENTLVIVVRYFGGKKLGAGGLIRAYVAAAKNVL